MQQILDGQTGVNTAGKSDGLSAGENDEPPKNWLIRRK